MLIHQCDNSQSNYHYNLSFYSNLYWPPHFHRNLELLYISDGEVTIMIDGEKQHIYKGQYALILSNQIHSYYSEKKSTSWIYVFSEEYVPEFISAIQKHRGSSAIFTCNTTVNTLLQTELINENSSVLMKKACLYAACDLYLQQAQLIDKKITSNRIGAVLDYISTHYCEDITLESIAKHFGYEYHYLSRLLNQGYSINFRKLVNEYRVEYAKVLLRINEKSIAEVAMLSGFQSIRSFNFVFKSITGQTPKDFCDTI